MVKSRKTFELFMEVSKNRMKTEKEMPSLFSGSVSGGNCKELAQQPDIDGFLVGGSFSC